MNSEFQIEFSQRLNTVVTPRPGDATIRVESKDLDGTAQNQSSEILACLESIQQQLAGFRNKIDSELKAVESKSIQLAFEIVKQLLSCDDELIRKRLQHNLQLGMEFSDESIKSIVVHPSCVEEIKLLFSNRDELQKVAILNDPNLAPGDCRIESGDMGLLASLDAQLDIIRKKINRDGGLTDHA